MLTFVQFLYETKDAQSQGYEFHHVDAPKGHHTIIATHPKEKGDPLGHTWLERDGGGPFQNGGTPKKFQKNVVGLAIINKQTHEPYTAIVHKNHQRKGVASAMYDHYAKTTGNKVVPSEYLSSDAKELWRARKKERSIKEEHEHGDFIRDDGGKPVSYFHGTRNAFDEFKPNVKKKMQLGFGMHFTPDASKAEFYTQKGNAKGDNPNIHKVHIRAKNPLDIDQMYRKDTHPKHFALHQELYKGTGRQPHVDSEGHFCVHPDVTNPARAEKLIRKHGFDAVKYTAVHPGYSGGNMVKKDQYPAIVAMHPNQIHSAFHPIKEDYKEDFKGWMSPSGHPHLFDSNEEHSENHHPEYKKINPKAGQDTTHWHSNPWCDKQIRGAQKHGFVRFGKSKDSIHGHHVFVHYDDRHPKGHETALKTLQYMNLHHNEPVSISSNTGSIDSSRIQKNLRDRVMPAREAMRDLHRRVHGVSEELIREESKATFKGWMSGLGGEHTDKNKKQCWCSDCD